MVGKDVLVQPPTLRPWLSQYRGKHKARAFNGQESCKHLLVAPKQYDATLTCKMYVGGIFYIALSANKLFTALFLSRCEYTLARSPHSYIQHFNELKHTCNMLPTIPRVN